MPALAWLDEQLAASGTSPDELVRVELQNQAAMNVTVRNVITSMRTMAAFDWAEFFEGVSLIDEALRADSDFGAMDFATRDRYRHAIEELARGSGRSELEVTREVIAHAKRAAAARPPDAPPGGAGRGSRVLPHLGRASRSSRRRSATVSRSSSGFCAPTSRGRPRATSGPSASSPRSSWRSLCSWPTRGG